MAVPALGFCHFLKPFAGLSVAPLVAGFPAIWFVPVLFASLPAVCLVAVPASVVKAASLPVRFYFLPPGFGFGKISSPVPKKERDTAAFQKYDPLHFPFFPVFIGGFPTEMSFLCNKA